MGPVPRSSKTSWRIGCYVNVGRHAGNELRNNLGARRSASHTEMTMAHRKEQSLASGRLAEDRETVGGGRTKSHPEAMLPGIHIGEHALDMLEQNLGAALVRRRLEASDLDRSGYTQPVLHWSDAECP